MVLIMSKFKDYRAYKAICDIFDEKTAHAMMEDAEQYESFVNSKDCTVNGIVCWKDTKYEEKWITVYYGELEYEIN